jgi:hypothetical protein
MKIAEIIKNENLESPAEIELLKTEVQQYLKTNMTNRTITICEQSFLEWSPAELSTFFRNLEREENSKRILQYMLSFLTNIPIPDNISGEPVNPVQQFKEFIQYQVGLLLEKDVIKAIMREYSQQGLLKPDNYWYYEVRIMDKRLELEHMLSQIPDDQLQTNLSLFRVLENLCLFWFDIGREDVRKARRSDIYMYKLARLLQIKLQKEAKP